MLHRLNFSFFPCTEVKIKSAVLCHFPLPKISVETNSFSVFLPVTVCLPRAREEETANLNFSERLIWLNWSISPFLRKKINFLLHRIERMKINVLSVLRGLLTSSLWSYESVIQCNSVLSRKYTSYLHGKIVWKEVIKF